MITGDDLNITAIDTPDSNITVHGSDINADGNITLNTTWSNTYINAGEQLILESVINTNLRGAVASGKQIIANIGGNLNIESLQDTSTFHSKDTHIGGSVTAGIGV